MKDLKKKKRSRRWGFYLMLSPIILFLIVAILVYIPPVQQFLVDKVTTALTEETGIDVKVGKVRLAFPLDLAVHQVVAKDEADTLADIRAVRLHIPILPLVKGLVNVDGFDIYDAKVNTGAWIPDLYLRGSIHRFSAAMHGVDLKKDLVNLDFVTLDGARLFIALGDSTVAEPDTVSDPLPWKVVLEKIALTNSELALSLPGDSVRIGFNAGEVSLRDGLIDLKAASYHVGKLQLHTGGLTYAVRSIKQDSIFSDSLLCVASACRDSLFAVSLTSDSLSTDSLCADSCQLFSRRLAVQPIAFADSDSLLWEGFTPQSEGIDPNYIVLQKFNFELEDINYLNDGQMSLGIRRFFLKERSGAQVNRIFGNIILSKGKLCLSDFSLHTPTSLLRAQSEIWLDSILGGRDDYGRLKVDGEISATDVKVLGNGFVPSSILERWPNSPIKMNLDVEGTSRTLQLDAFKIDWPQVATLTVQGQVLHPFTDHRIGKMDFDLSTNDLSFVHSLMKTEAELDMELPVGFALYGSTDINGSQYGISSKILGGEGRILFDGNLDLLTEKYSGKLVSEHFPLSSFLPGMGMGALSATVDAVGRGFDFLADSTKLEATASLDTLRYGDWQLGQTALTLNYAEKHGKLGFSADNDVLMGDGELEAKLGDLIELTLKSDLPDLKISNLAGMKDPLSFGTALSLDVYSDWNFKTYGLGGGLTNVRFVTAEKGIPARDLYFSFDSSVDTTLFAVSSGDMDLNLSASGNLDKISKDVNVFLSTFQHQLLTKQLNQAALKDVAPTLSFQLKTGTVNPLSNFIREMGYAYHLLDLNLSVSPEKGVLGYLDMSGLAMGKTVFDTLKMDLKQDTTGLVANAWVKNYKKKNKTKFEGALKSYLLDSGAGVELVIRNHDGVKGMDFGILADIIDDGVKVHLYPENPVIVFRDFKVNKDNYIFLGNDSTVRADVNLLAKDGTGLRIYSQPVDSVNDLTVSLNHLDLAALSGVLSSVPNMQGLFNGDVHIIDDHKSLSAMSAISLENFVLDGAPFGNIGAEVIYLPQDSTQHHASIFVSADDAEVLALNGLYTLDGKHESFEGNAELLEFPLELLNGFLAGTDLAMSGRANGILNVTGDLSTPSLNGELNFNGAHIYSEVYGFNFRMDEQPVRFVDNQMLINDYALYSRQSSNPLLLNGTLDMRNLSNVKMDFSMKAKNFELINTKKQAKSLVYGKVYTDFDGSMRGTLDNLSVRGKLSILDRTDMTYILKDSPLTVDDRLHDLVQFVDFEETEVEEEPVLTPSGEFNMTLGIAINDAALFHCNLSEDGSNYVDLEGGGDLTLRLTQQGDMRLTGRFTANSGEMKYSLPVIPLKTFKLVRGSYVDFTGDVLNPTLSIAAKERVKAMVTENDQPRSVAFDVGVSITQPLDRMGLEFTIEAPEDLTVQNQLATMTKAERGKAAVGMLATGMYLTDESMSSSTSGFKASNALTSFLQNEIQNIAGSALKTIDLTIGMENNTSATGATTTDYSFQFAKRFWGNRISVIVGGKVSTGAEADNSAESFIDNVAVEYRLDKTASRYVRVFYERSFQDPLEGQLTKTGAGLVLRRKSDRLGDLFIFRNREPKKKENKSAKAKN